MMNAAFHSELIRLARRMVWDKPPDEALADTVLLLVRVMSLGTLDDVQTAKRFYSKADFRRALKEAPPGTIDPRSWAYWCLMLGEKASTSPPARTLPA